MINTPVIIKAHQPHRFAWAQKYPGRRGVVIRQSAIEQDMWYVRLEQFGRSPERIELFWADELEVRS